MKPQNRVEPERETLTGWFRDLQTMLKEFEIYLGSLRNVLSSEEK
jgi:hypothetical protein